jgi:hypothetical protein
MPSFPEEFNNVNEMLEELERRRSEGGINNGSIEYSAPE